MNPNNYQMMNQMNMQINNNTMINFNNNFNNFNNFRMNQNQNYNQMMGQMMKPINNPTINSMYNINNYQMINETTKTIIKPKTNQNISNSMDNKVLNPIKRATTENRNNEKVTKNKEKNNSIMNKKNESRKEINRLIPKMIKESIKNENNLLKNNIPDKKENDAWTELKFSNIKDVLNCIIDDIIGQFLNGKKYDSNKAQSWCNNISDEVIKCLHQQEIGFKFIATSTIFQKGNASLNFNSTCLWNPSSDGSITVKYENESLHCFVCLFGIGP